MEQGVTLNRLPKVLGGSSCGNHSRRQGAVALAQVLQLHGDRVGRMECCGRLSWRWLATAYVRPTLCVWHVGCRCCCFCREQRVGQGVYVPTNNFFVEEGDKLKPFASMVPDKTSKGFALFPIVEAPGFGEGIIVIFPLL